MIPLASGLIPFPGQMRREDHGKPPAARPTFFIWSLCDCGHHFSEVSSGTNLPLWIRSPRATDQQDEFLRRLSYAQKLGPRPGRMFAGRALN
jgi:hypothetical protein